MTKYEVFCRFVETWSCNILRDRMAKNDLCGSQRLLCGHENEASCTIRMMHSAYISWVAVQYDHSV